MGIAYSTEMKLSIISKFFLITLLITINIFSLPALAQELIPHPDKPFSGKVGLTYKDSQPVKSQLKLPSTYGLENAPNILLVLLDDVGYGQMGTFGGVVPTRAMDSLAKNGLKYTQFHTTALCSPTRAALLTGRNHHSAGTGVITELGTGFPAYSGEIPKSAGAQFVVSGFQLESDFKHIAQFPSELQTQPIPKQRIADELIANRTNSQISPFNLFIIFFVTLGPIKIIPPFVRLTKNADKNLRRQLAFRSAAISTIVIVLVAIVGQNILKVWQIRLPSLMIAGGILLFLVALQIVMSQYNPTAKAESPEEPSLNLVVTPLVFPTRLPPFGIAIALTLMVMSPKLGISSLIVLGLILLVMGLNVICMLAANSILYFLKPITLLVLGFTLGVMQLALGVELIVSGIEIEVLVLQRLLGS